MVVDLKCVLQIFQKPRDEPYLALFPPTLHVGDESVSQQTPDEQLPPVQTYETRARDCLQYSLDPLL